MAARSRAGTTSRTQVGVGEHRGRPPVAAAPARGRSTTTGRPTERARVDHGAAPRRGWLAGADREAARTCTPPTSGSAASRASPADPAAQARELRPAQPLDALGARAAGRARRPTGRRRRARRPAPRPVPRRRPACSPPRHRSCRRPRTSRPRSTGARTAAADAGRAATPRRRAARRPARRPARPPPPTPAAGSSPLDTTTTPGRRGSARTAPAGQRVGAEQDQRRVPVGPPQRRARRWRARARPRPPRAGAAGRRGAPRRRSRRAGGRRGAGGRGAAAVSTARPCERAAAPGEKRQKTVDDPFGCGRRAGPAAPDLSTYSRAL